MVSMSAQLNRVSAPKSGDDGISGPGKALLNICGTGITASTLCDANVDAIRPIITITVTVERALSHSQSKYLTRTRKRTSHNRDHNGVIPLIDGWLANCQIRGRNCR